MKKSSIYFVVGSLSWLAACAETPVRTPNSDHAPQISVDSSVSTAQAQPRSTNDVGFFDWPVDSARLTRGFLPKNKSGRKRAHLGIDLAAKKGTPILAAQDGLVIYVGSGFTGYGRMIMIEGKNNFATLYAHLSKAHVDEGDRVVKGQVIGAMGRTGRATGTHLHFEIRKNKGPVDPLLYLPMPTFPMTRSARGN